MGQEIERKYLVRKDAWQAFDKPAGEHYRQGYILADPAKTIRVRLTETAAFLTIKGLSVGATRPEYEYEIPAADAEELLDAFSLSELSKTRYKIPFGNKIWEVDEFAGANAGLIITEIELDREDEDFPLPDWIGEEVTGDERYYNSRLATHPYTEWL